MKKQVAEYRYRLIVGNQIMPRGIGLKFRPKTSGTAKKRLLDYMNKHKTGKWACVWGTVECSVNGGPWLTAYRVSVL